MTLCTISTKSNSTHKLEQAIQFAVQFLIHLELKRSPVPNHTEQKRVSRILCFNNDAKKTEAFTRYLP